VSARQCGEADDLRSEHGETVISGGSPAISAIGPIGCGKHAHREAARAGSHAPSLGRNYWPAVRWATPEPGVLLAGMAALLDVACLPSEWRARESDPRGSPHRARAPQRPSPRGLGEPAHGAVHAGKPRAPRGHPLEPSSGATTEAVRRSAPMARRALGGMFDGTCAWRAVRALRAAVGLRRPEHSIEEPRWPPSRSLRPTSRRVVPAAWSR
jgi:hypothetical protein